MLKQVLPYQLCSIGGIAYFHFLWKTIDRLILFFIWVFLFCFASSEQVARLYAISLTMRTIILQNGMEQYCQLAFVALKRNPFQYIYLQSIKNSKPVVFNIIVDLN
ncbi:hypothetical protein J3Q64DRAFT_1704543 [Phycomyces blakesleeanus]|uniref:Uncharacterized protein n=1 Tax=Phycomyces blakesleeanus TaxID=4837 RepID=A0ABR3AGZ2_PHYBL